MRNPLYLRQLKRDLNQWVEDGVVDAESADYMMETAGQKGPKRSISASLSVLGVILLGFAAMSFIAANFWGLPKIIQLGLLMGSMALAYGASWWLIQSGHEALGHAAILLGVVLFGVNIMLIAQIYHISSHYPDGVMLWAIGALLAAVLIPSRAALAVALVIASIWTGLESMEFDVAFHAPFLIFWAVAAIAAHVLRWRPGFHLSALALVFWLGLNSVHLAESYNWEAGELMSLYAVLWLTVWALGAVLLTTSYPYASTLQQYGVVLFFASFFILPLLPAEDMGNLQRPWVMAVSILVAASIVIAVASWVRQQITTIDLIGLVGASIMIVTFPFLSQSDNSLAGTALLAWLYSGAFLLFSVWALSYGERHDDRFIINVSFIGFGAEVLYIYFKTFGTLLHQSVFFAIGGVLLIALSILLERLRQRIIDDTMQQVAS